jgi:Fe-S cluster assembly iron-binding protein IscA
MKQIGVKLGIFQDYQIKQGIEDTLKTKKLIYFADQEADLEISETNNIIDVTIPATANVYAQFRKSKSLKAQITETIIDFARAKIISSLEINNPNFKANINLKHANLNNSSSPVIFEDSVESYPTFTTAESGWVIIKNTGDSAFYFTLLDIQPDGQISVILPDENKGYGYEQVRLMPGQQRGFPVDEFSPPLGIEKFKVIMSPKPQNFSFLNSSNRDYTSRTSTKNNESFLEDLFRDLANGITQATSRNVSVVGIPAIGGTCSFTFKIVDAKK